MLGVYAHMCVCVCVCVRARAWACAHLTGRCHHKIARMAIIMGTSLSLYDL